MPKTKEIIKDLTLYQKIQNGVLNKEDCIELALKNLRESSELEIDLTKIRLKIAELITKNRSMSQMSALLKNKSTYFMLMSDSKEKAKEFKDLLAEKIHLEDGN